MAFWKCLSGVPGLPALHGFQEGDGLQHLRDGSEELIPQDLVPFIFVRVVLTVRWLLADKLTTATDKHGEYVARPRAFSWFLQGQAPGRVGSIHCESPIVET